MTGQNQHVWNNGLTQNIYHFAQLLQAIPFVEKVYFLNCGDQEYHPAGSDDLSKSVPLISPTDALDEIDVAFEMGGAISVEWIQRFRHKGGKFVLHLCGQPYVGLVEPTVFNRTGFFIDALRGNEIWILEKDRIFAPFLRTIHRCNVFEVPYIWAPRFLEQTLRRSPEGELLFGYRKGALAAAKGCPAIFEPNISPIKMGLIPFQICETVARQFPDAIDVVQFLNGNGMTTHPTYVSFMQGSKLYQDGKVQITGRDFFSHVMEGGKNIVISHQIHCPQNYVYLDALWGGYPLIHNSEIFRDYGYYYEASDVAAGAAAFMRAFEQHDSNLETYRADAKRLIASLSPLAPANIDHYARRLLDLQQPDANKTLRRGRA